MLPFAFVELSDNSTSLCYEKASLRARENIEPLFPTQSFFFAWREVLLFFRTDLDVETHWRIGGIAVGRC